MKQINKQKVYFHFMKDAGDVFQCIRRPIFGVLDCSKREEGRVMYI